MLRNMVLALGATMFVAGVGGILSKFYIPAIVLIVWGAMIVFAIIYERYSPTYRKVSAKAPTGKHWVQTDERVVEKKTGRVAVVYHHTWTGERIYVPVSEVRAP